MCMALSLLGNSAALKLDYSYSTLGTVLLIHYSISVALQVSVASVLFNRSFGFKSDNVCFDLCCYLSV